jgi:hypothetical protein
MLGLGLWTSALARPSHLKLVLAGVFWGLAFQSKWLFLFALPAAVASWGILALAGRRLPSRVYLLPALGLVLPTAAFFALRVSEFGFGGEMEHLARLWRQHGGRAAGFEAGEGQVTSIFAVARPLITLAQTDFWSVLGVFLTLPAIGYAIVQLRRRLDPLPLYLLTFTLIWAVWWLLFSYDLAVPHILYIMPFVQIYVAKLLVDGWQAARGRGPAAAAGHRPLHSGLLAAIGLIVFGKTLVPLATDIDAIYRAKQTLAPAYRQMVEYVDRNTEPAAIFSGWGWSVPWWLAIDADRTVKNRGRYPFEQRETRPEYLVITPEWPLERLGTGWPNMAYANQWTIAQNERRREFIARHCDHLLTTGTDYQWAIYRVNPLPAASAAEASVGGGAAR